jgi:hypothetical protein
MQFTYNGKVYDGDPWAFAPVQENHEDYGRRLHEFWGIPEAEARSISDTCHWQIARAKRDELLAATDWVVARATELGEAVPSDYATYRQALRDITQQTDPRQIEWPLLNGQTGGAQSPQFTGGEVVEEDNPLFKPGT